MNAAGGNRAPAATRSGPLAFIAIAAALVTLLAAGLSRRDLVTVTATASLPAGSALRTGGPLPTEIIRATELGLSVANDASDPWTSVSFGWFGFVVPGTRDFHYAACPDDTCVAGLISVSVAPLETGFVIAIKAGPRQHPTCPPKVNADLEGCWMWQLFSGEFSPGPPNPVPVRLPGASMDALIAAAKQRLGLNVELRDVNGVRWAIVERSSRIYAFVVHGPSVVSVTAHPIGYGEAAAATLRQRLERFLTAIEFDESAAPLPTWAEPGSS
jgi:hypothetical protein